MENNLYKKIRYWDVKSFIAVVISLALIAMGWIYLHDIRSDYRENKISSFKGETQALIIAIEPIQVMKQSRWGTNIYIDHYNVQYKYWINGKSYLKADLIIASGKNEKLITRIMNRTSTEKFRLKYDLADPSKSLIVE